MSLPINLSFFNLLPDIALAGLAVMIGVVVWMIWRSASPAAPGISQGYLEILGRYGGGKMLKSIKGTMVEATQLFLDPRTDQMFRKILSEDIASKVKLEGGDAAVAKDPELAELKKAAETFKNDTVSLSKLCRIIVTRDRFFGKNVIVQYENVAPLSEYAAVDPTSKFTFSMGFLSQGIVTGEISTLSEPWVVHGLGECNVFLFKPDSRAIADESELAQLEADPEVKAVKSMMGPGQAFDILKPSIKKYLLKKLGLLSSGAVELPAYLAKLALHAPSYVEATELLRSKDEQITQLRRENAKIGSDLSASATFTDGLLTATEGFRTKEGGPEMAFTPPRRFGMAEFLFLFAPTLIGYYIGVRYLNLDPLYGMLVGLAAGSYLVWRRMG